MPSNTPRSLVNLWSDQVFADRASIAALALAWLGIWGAWIPHHTASLTQNAIYLADWSDILTDVRLGPLAHIPNVLRLAVALAVVALCLSLRGVRSPWLRWGLRALAVLPGFVLLPPYPQVLSLWRSEVYGARFVVAAVLWVGAAACLLLDLLPAQARRVLAAVFATGALALGAWAFLALRGPFSAHYAARILPGWGVLIFCAGLAAAAGLQIVALAAAARAVPPPA